MHEGRISARIQWLMGGMQRVEIMAKNARYFFKGETFPPL
jgi:hypothetical protein